MNVPSVYPWRFPIGPGPDPHPFDAEETAQRAPSCSTHRDSVHDESHCTGDTAPRLISSAVLGFGIQATYPPRLGATPHEFIRRVQRRCEEIAARGGDPRPAIRAELATVRAVFEAEYGAALDVAIHLEGGEVVQ